jgi:ATP-dependent RNA helicase DHX33
VVYVKGRLHAVTISHATEPQDDFVDSALRTAFKIHLDKAAIQGDILIFMPGPSLSRLDVCLLTIFRSGGD